jgi:acyl-CoA synthetase (AMP-forming)/AMP-acid ligase II
MLIIGNRTLKTALEDKARRFSDQPFLLFEAAAGETGRWTWREFDQAVNRAANLLMARGLRHGDRFNLHLGNCPEFLIFWLAAAKTGTVMVPTNPVSTADEMAYILTHSEARLAVTDPQYDPVRDQAIKAYVILKNGAAASTAELIEWCRGRLSPFKVPELIEFRDAFPRTSVGKIQKHLF